MYTDLVHKINSNWKYCSVNTYSKFERYSCRLELLSHPRLRVWTPHHSFLTEHPSARYSKCETPSLVSNSQSSKGNAGFILSPICGPWTPVRSRVSLLITYYQLKLRIMKDVSIWFVVTVKLLLQNSHQWCQIYATLYCISSVLCHSMFVVQQFWCKIYDSVYTCYIIYKLHSLVLHLVHNCMKIVV